MLASGAPSALQQGSSTACSPRPFSTGSTAAQHMQTGTLQGPAVQVQPAGSQANKHAALQETTAAWALSHPQSHLGTPAQPQQLQDLMPNPLNSLESSSCSSRKGRKPLRLLSQRVCHLRPRACRTAAAWQALLQHPASLRHAQTTKGDSSSKGSGRTSRVQQPHLQQWMVLMVIHVCRQQQGSRRCCMQVQKLLVLVLLPVLG